MKVKLTINLKCICHNTIYTVLMYLVSILHTSFGHWKSWKAGWQIQVVWQFWRCSKEVIVARRLIAIYAVTLGHAFQQTKHCVQRKEGASVLKWYFLFVGRDLEKKRALSENLLLVRAQTSYGFLKIQTFGRLFERISLIWL